MTQNDITQEEKQLLLVDLSARLPYGVKVKINEVMSNPLGCELIGVLAKAETVYVHLIPTSIPIEEVKPYLRPLSSMTEKEEEKYGKLTQALIKEDDKVEYLIRLPNYNTLDWLNEHFYDYRGLIEMGLALPAPEGMYEH